MLTRLIQYALVFFVATLEPVIIHGQSSDLAGNWEGNISQPGSVQAVSISIEMGKDGSFKGTADLPGQYGGDQLRPLINIDVRDQYVSFGIAGVPGKPVFDGSLSVDGRTYSGNFSQDSKVASFTLHKDIKTTKASSIKVGRLTGVWKGSLEAGALKLNFVLTASGSTGRVAMTMEIAGNDIRELNVSVAVEDNEIRLNVPILSAVYVGSIDEEAEIISGTWRQADARLPLTFKKVD